MTGIRGEMHGAARQRQSRQQRQPRHPVRTARWRCTDSRDRARFALDYRSLAATQLLTVARKRKPTMYQRSPGTFKVRTTNGRRYAQINGLRFSSAQVCRLPPPPPPEDSFGRG